MRHRRHSRRCFLSVALPSIGNSPSRPVEKRERPPPRSVAKVRRCVGLPTPAPCRRTGSRLGRHPKPYTFLDIPSASPKLTFAVRSEPNPSRTLSRAVEGTPATADGQKSSHDSKLQFAHDNRFSSTREIPNGANTTCGYDGSYKSFATGHYAPRDSRGIFG
jgi:hypothetical protein